VQIAHFLSLSDDTGMLQHALHCVADRSHGYCIDDNAAPCWFACHMNRAGEQPLPDLLTARSPPSFSTLESRQQTISQFHGLRSALARG